MFSMETFGEWLENELKKRDWSQNDLAKYSGLAHGTISNILNGNKGIGDKSLSAIARALKLPPEVVFRAAGLLPPKPASNPTLDEATHILSLLDPDDLQEIIDLARVKLDRQSKKSRIKPARTVLKEG